jgi:serine/threonine protein kinase
MLEFLDKEDALAGCRLLGEGGHERVYQVPLQRDVVVAIKCARYPTLNYLAQKYYWDFESLSFIRHRNLVRLLAYVFRTNCHFFVYEFVPGGSLQDALMNQMAAKKLTLSWPHRHRILCGVARGLASLHDGSLSSSIVHRNLKPANILLDEGYEAKIGDFSLAALNAHVGTHRVPAVFYGMDGFVSPECLLGGR